ncbi:MAG: MotA/TolQ/ExbB proton channel family protein [Isosphaeraceae bacterium]
MRRSPTALSEPLLLLFRCSALVLLLGPCASAASKNQPAPASLPAPSATDLGPRAGPSPSRRYEGRRELDLLDAQSVRRHLASLLRLGADWYRRTPPGERMCWGGLFACAFLGLVVTLERLARLRPRKIIPAEFTARFLDRLHEGKLDGGKALDYCEMNPSPAARIALAAVRRWGRPAVDLERAVTLAHRVEAERLRRNVGTLRRIAALAPLLGLLGTLLTIGRVLAALPTAGSTAWGTGIASALLPLTLGVALATLALVAYDSLVVRIERLAGSLDRLGAETLDAIAMAAPPTPRSLVAASAGSRIVDVHAGHAPEPGALARSPRQPRPPGRQTVEGGRRSSSRDHDLGF